MLAFLGQPFVIMATRIVRASQEFHFFALLDHQMAIFATGAGFHVIRFFYHGFFLGFAWGSIQGSGVTAIGEIAATDEFFAFFGAFVDQGFSAFRAILPGRFGFWSLFLDVFAGNKAVANYFSLGDYNKKCTLDALKVFLKVEPSIIDNKTLNFSRMFSNDLDRDNSVLALLNPTL